MQARYQCLVLADEWSWRLLGANHRELARASGRFATLQAAAADACEVAALAADGEIEILAAPASSWRWVLSVDGVPRARSAVGYARRLECQRAVSRFRECAPEAAVLPVPLVRRGGWSPGGRTGQSRRDKPAPAPQDGEPVVPPPTAG